MYVLRATARGAKRVLAIAILSVCLSVCLSVLVSFTFQYQSELRWGRDSGFSPYDSVVFYFFVTKFHAALGKRFPSNEGTPKQSLFYRY